MKQLFAFTKKEFTELKRTSRLTILLILFSIIGIMNPAIAKMTPWMFDMMGDDLEKQGIVIKQITVTALDSWAQYYKNSFMMLVIFTVLFSGIFTNEYLKGTLIQMLTKGLARSKVLAAKGIMMLITWSFCYWLAFFITYGYTVYFWDNYIAHHVWTGAVCLYITGIWLISMILLFSSFEQTGSAVMMSCAGTFAVSYLLGIIPRLSAYMPTHLLDAGAMISGAADTDTYIKAAVVTCLLSVLSISTSVILFNKRKI